MPHLQQLPNHHRFQHRADPTGGHNIGVRSSRTLMQSREKRAVFEGLTDKYIDILLEREVDTDADVLHTLRGRPGAPPLKLTLCS